MSFLRILVVTTGFAAVGFSGVCLAGKFFSDGFEAPRLDAAKWSLKKMPKRRHWIDTHQKRSGNSSLAIRVKGYDLDPVCKCQRSEIREANGQRLTFGDDAWYAFSFKITGRGGIATDNRWQIGSWKQETDGSPFLSQRFDNGVFHITLESDTSRVLVATAQGKADSFISTMAKGLMSRFGFLSQKEKYDGKDDITLAYGANPILPSPQKGWVDMVYHIRGGLNSNGLVEIFANGRFIARATGTIGVKDTAGPTQYFRFGHNRSPMPGTATVFIDNFKRGKTRAEVELR